MRMLRVRLTWVVILFAIGFTLVSTRLIYLQLVMHDFYLDEAIKMHYVTIPIPPRRGEILDRSGNVLAQSVEVTDLRIDGKRAWATPGTFERLAQVFGMQPAEIKKIVSPTNRYQLLRTEMPLEDAARLKALKDKSLVFVEKTARFYPCGSEAAHVLGVVNIASFATPLSGQPVEFEVGVDGVEKTMDRYLKGIPGERRVVRDAGRKEIAAFRRADRPAIDGDNIELTIDQVIQHIVEVEADNLEKTYHPEGIHIIVTRPSTGDILAMTNRPTFDPNNRGSITDATIRNGCVQSLYEPGSTFKLVTLAAGLNERMINLDTNIYCEQGRFFHAGAWLTDHEPFGILNVRQVVEHSSNIGFAKVAMMLGGDKVYEYARAFGYGGREQLAPIALPGEERGILYPTKKWSALSITRIPMGYEVMVTNLQVAMAYSAIANNGNLMVPRIVKAVTDEQGRTISEFLPRAARQVVRPETAALIREALAGVVSDEGTAKLAAVPGFQVGGKTGTAQRLTNGAYDKTHYTASFIGFMPLNQPEFLVSIVVDAPKGQVYGGKVAGPAFRNIATQIAAHMNLNPEGTPVVVADRNDS